MLEKVRHISDHPPHSTFLKSVDVSRRQGGKEKEQRSRTGSNMPLGELTGPSVKKQLIRNFRLSEKHGVGFSKKWQCLIDSFWFLGVLLEPRLKICHGLKSVFGKSRLNDFHEHELFDRDLLDFFA